MQRKILKASDRYKDVAYKKLYDQIQRHIIAGWSREGETSDLCIQDIINGRNKIKYEVEQVIIKKDK